MKDRMTPRLDRHGNNRRRLIETELQWQERAVSKSFTNRATNQTAQVDHVPPLETCGLEELPMAKFAISDSVAKGKSAGTIVALFTATDGKLVYAVEDEGALQFVLESELA
jgi:hypothetical protein